MKYVERTLREGERVIHTAKLDWMHIFDLWVLGLAVLVLALIAGNTEGTVSIWVGVFTAVMAVNMLNVIIAIRTTEMAVTNKRVIYKHGWISRKTKELRLDAFESCELEQGVWGRLLRYRARLIVSGRGNQSIEYKRLGSEDALAFKSAIEQAVERN